MSLTIKALHEDIDKAADEVLNEAKRILSSVNNEVIKTYSKLYKMGFTSSPSAKKAYEKIMEVGKARSMSRLIRLYKKEYPDLMFLPTEKAEEICKKYDLYIADVRYFIGEIPYDVAKSIASFDGVKPEHKAYYIKIRGFNTVQSRSISYWEYRREAPKRTLSSNIFYSCDDGLKVIAPRDMFAKDLESDGVRLRPKVEDPIILYPVRGGYLVIAAWGDEEDIVKEVM